MAAQDESDTPPEGADLAPGEFPHIKLDTLGDVRREIARVYRNMRMGKLSTETGNGLTHTLNVLASVMQDHRDSLWTKRARVMWEERQKANGAGAPANH